VKVGEEMMANGDIVAARMMFQRAAQAGDAAGAFALAETYDPMVLSTLRLRGGITPDVALARSWYERARELGSVAAPDRIVRLAQVPR
jgi:TPR repeat protein